MSKPIAPITKRAGEYWIDTSELLSDVPEYGGYESRAAAEEDRAGVVERIKQRRSLGLKGPDQEIAIQATDLRDTILLLKKFTRSRFKFDKLTDEQATQLSTKFMEFKGVQTKVTSVLKMTPDVLKVLLYREAGIDSTWPESDHAFYQWAARFVSKIP